MSKVCVAFIIVAVVLTCLPAGVLSQEGFAVRELKITGNNTLSGDLLRARMATYSTGAFRQNILGKEPFQYSEDILKSDLQRLVRLYQREGFLYARAELDDVKTNVKGQTVRVFVSIVEGDSITINDVRWEIDATASSSIDSLLNSKRPQTQTRAGRRFRDATIEADRHMFALALENFGYPYCEVVPSVEVDEDRRLANVLWSVRPGKRCTFGDVSISGAARVSPDLIENRLKMGRGDTYSRAALDKSQRRIYDLSLFHIVTVTAQLTEARDTLVPVEVHVAEAPRLTSKLGVGYGREEKFRVYSDSYYLSFLGGARRLNFYAKHSSLEPYHFSLRLIQPGFLTSNTTLEIKPFVLRQQEPGFTENRFGGSISLLHEFSRYLHGSITHSLERVNLDTTSVAELSELESDLSDDYNKSSLLPGLTFDNSSPMFSPSKGFYVAGAGKISGLDLGSDFHFTRILFDIRRYQPVMGMVLAGRIKAGGIRSNDDHGFVPPEDRFYAGGSASVRGWARAQLGPLDDEGTPLGGYSLFEGSISLRFPILGIVSGAIFSDFGNVWTGSYSYHVDDLRYSAGGGIRVKTPIGPVRLDAARPVSDIETKWQFHISVGEAF